MPKVNLRTREEIENNAIRAEIIASMNDVGIRQQNELARRSKIPQSTLSVHLSNPGRLTLEELRKISRVTGLVISIKRRVSDGLM